jgi:hypothetical protein
MASTITITCPECDKQLKASSDMLGKKIRCKGCGATFAARAPGKSAPAREPDKKDAPADKSKKAQPKGKPASDEDDKPYGVTEEYLGRRCPDCTEALDDEQVICLNCGYNTMTRIKGRVRKVRDITGGDIFLWLLPGIACALLVLILLGFDLWYIIQVDREMFGDAWYDFIGASGTKIWFNTINIYIMYLAGKFAIRRLVFNYMPPEVEEKMDYKPK